MRYLILILLFSIFGQAQISPDFDYSRRHFTVNSEGVSIQQYRGPQFERIFEENRYQFVGDYQDLLQVRVDGLEFGSVQFRSVGNLANCAGLPFETPFDQCPTYQEYEPVVTANEGAGFITYSGGITNYYNRQTGRHNSNSDFRIELTDRLVHRILVPEWSKFVWNEDELAPRRYDSSNGIDYSDLVSSTLNAFLVSDFNEEWRAIHDRISLIQYASIHNNGTYDNIGRDYPAIALSPNSGAYTVIHELGHAYHDLVLEGGEGNAEVIRLWNEMKAAVGTNSYWATNEREFFAEIVTFYLMESGQMSSIPNRYFAGSSINSRLNSAERQYYRDNLHSIVEGWLARTVN